MSMEDLEKLNKEQLIPIVVDLQEKVAELTVDSQKLSALHAAGVDNWDWYGEAMKSFRENDEDY